MSTKGTVFSCDCKKFSASRNIHPCPKYADVGCFTSILRHEENGVDYDDVLRGCSSFEQEYACSGWTERQLDANGNPTGDAVEWNSCKETCSGANCNNDKALIAGDNRCYVCTAQVDSHGDTIGLGDEFCFNSDLADHNESVVECGRNEHCITDIEVDWLPMGEQLTTVRRRCGSEEIVPQCVTSITNGWAAKDCFSSCKGTLCNDNLDVADLLTENVVNECFNCKFNEMTSSNHGDDVEQCKGSPIAETMTSCPRWAKAACFVADAVIREDDGTDLVSVYRGCSAFSEELFGSMMKCSSITVDIGVDTDQPDRRVASICKQQCTEADDCNSIKYPDYQPPEEEECPPCDDVVTTTDEAHTSEPAVTTEQPDTDEPGTDEPPVPTTEPPTAAAFKHSVAAIFLSFTLFL